MELTVNSLTNLAEEELGDATAAITAGDEGAERLAGDIRRLVTQVNRASEGALSRASALRADDVSNPAGVARQLAAIPGDLKNGTDEQLQQAETTLDVIEGRHLNAILRHDSRNDAALIFEVSNFVEGLKKGDAAPVLLRLCDDPRYATFMAGPAGLSLAARFGLKDADLFRKVALDTLAKKGTDDQRRRSAALAELGRVRRVIGLARGGRDHIAEEVRRPPTPGSI